MQSLWNDQEAARHASDLAQRVYTSRLLGSDPTLVMHGGGNTSVKIREQNIFDEAEDRLYVKGSGWNLATIEAEGFSPLRLEPLLKLARLEKLTDPQMAAELRAALVNPSAPSPSVEAILHASLPHKFVDHSHADAIVAITNTPDGRARIEAVFGRDVIVIPYVMPGFRLARLVAELYPQHATTETIGMVLLNHGLFTFGDDARTSYERHIALVSRAEDYLRAHNAWQIAVPDLPAPQTAQRSDLAAFRKQVAAVAGFPVIMTTHQDAQSLHFARRDDVSVLSQQGPATPDHVLHTKRVPLVGRDLDAFAAAYEAYFSANAERSDTPLVMLDPAPRVILDPDFGMITVGRSAGVANIAADIYRTTIKIILQATALGGWAALPPADIFDVEYWDLEQAKLRKAGKPPVFSGEIALVTGAASGIGKACVESLLARGAAVVALDINPAVETAFKRPDYLGIACDLTQAEKIEAALEAGVRRFGGLDILILNAGIFPPSRPIADLDSALWEKTMSINLQSNLTLMREAFPLLQAAPNGGRVVYVGSKNVPAPGPGAAAYSASKAAATQLMRVAALEWGDKNIRVNIVHPNNVFDTALWTEEVLQARAASYGVSVAEYKARNVLKQEVRSADVAEVVAELCSPLFAKTTGAQIPIDGGNERVI